MPGLIFEILESGQKVPLRLEGTALSPRLSLSHNAFNFGNCVMYDHRETILTMSNKHDLPYQFSFVVPAHFGVSPASGMVPSNGTTEITLSFKPHQVGPLGGTMQLLGFGGKVLTQSIRVVVSISYGRALASNQTRMPAHCLDAWLVCARRVSVPRLRSECLRVAR